MKISLFGSGKMSRIVSSLLGEDELVDLASSDVCIDFSHADSVPKHVAQAMMARVPIVVGTTGWNSKIDYVTQMVKEAKGALLYGANFSVGTYLFSRLVRHANILLHEFDVSGYEIHHKEKADRPSGTAIELENIIAQRRENTPSFESVRIGSSLGVHSVLFDGEHETIECTHRAKNREGYGRGALDAAEWLIGKTGVFTFEEYMEERLTWTYRELSLR